MSALLSVVSQVVAASPSPSPTVVTVIQTVQVTPEWVNNLAEFLKQAALLLGLVIPGMLASKIQSAVSKSKDGTKRFSQWQNAAIVFLYSFVIGGLGLLAELQFNFVNVDFSSPATYGAAFLVVLGAASARYNRLQLKAEPAPVI